MNNHTTPSPQSATSTRRSATSSLLAKFLPEGKIEHKMDLQKGKDRTPKPRSSRMNVSYAQSEGSSTKSTSSTPQKDRLFDLAKDDEDDEEDEESEHSEDELIEYAATPRRITVKQFLRPRRANMSLKALENGDPSSRRTRPAKSRSTKSKGKVKVTERLAIRHEIANKTKGNRDRFFVDKKDLLLPLLPDNNYVRKLAEKHDRLSEKELADLPTVLPYEELESQPKGVKATMKPYQLSGLSFMLYLHRNGLSGILGDEMGLGKTLQTLSLIQHLKENDPKSGTGKLQRPFLIVCPLSVLSSWMTESRKWTPGLKAIRFHGPVNERNKMKRIVMGEIDFYGNMTAQARAKSKSKKNAAGKQVVSLDTDSGDEKDEDVGVDLVVTTYDCFRVEQSWFKTAFIWRYVVLDEGHTVKNHQSLVSKSLQGLKAEYRLILTGTPLQNNLSELWSLLHWLYPEVFTANTNELFDTSFNLTKGQYSNVVLDNSRKLLELIMLRRMKTSPGVDLNLPPKTEVLLFVPLSPMQRFWYERMITRADQGLLDELFKGAKDKETATIGTSNDDSLEAEEKALEVFENDALLGTKIWQETKAILEGTVRREAQEAVLTDGVRKRSDWQKLMNLLMQLRKVCNHPYQISGAQPDPYHVGDHLVHASGKFIVLEKLINELVIKEKKKILIFSGFTLMLDMVEELLHLRGGDGSKYRYARIDGATVRARRNLSIRTFNDLQSDYRVMLISTRAGGLGINLAAASDVVLLDQDWNPQITLQAEARAHRIGQKNPVTIYKLVSQGTVEEQMMGRIQKKLYLSAKVTEAMQDIHTKFGAAKGRQKGRPSEVDENMPQLSTGELMTLVRRGASAISRPEIDVNEMLSWDWETTVLKCKDQPADHNVKKDAIPDAQVDEEAEKKWLSEMERVESSVFAGKKLARGKYKTTKEIAQDFDRADRRAGKNTTIMVDGFAISKESMNCKMWEAVPTMGDKNPIFKEPARPKKAPIKSQSHCQVCFDGGELLLCEGCPRSYHYNCLPKGFQAKSKAWNGFRCPQHECADCAQKTSDAGGMLYRCRWCEHAYCEDCIDFEDTILIGDNLIEYEVLDYPEVPQAFYVQCHACTDNFIENPNNKVVCDLIADQALVEHEQKLNREDREASTQPGSLTDATTTDTTGVNTPIVIDDESMFGSIKKRKMDISADEKGTSSKKMRNGSSVEQPLVLW
ncbi:ISWI chromatin-remodeling complex ATPase ISW2 [Amylocarpus encephaloides]|uniref:ISWI chromatin-remodeling complex ATPase ISW2 n=1 Tax=Amylocarpus encephaloides TaxID=45428 RepID=A0A9P7Y8I3_9HELO|nr:ISWI chromatin-remodeling complex ATPase ISW2 [Amylocarpus encephaloides]